MLFMFEDFNLRLFFNQLKVIEKENNLFMLNYLKKKINLDPKYKQNTDLGMGI